MDINVCTYPGDREAAIVSHLYDEADAAERRRFEAHLVSCARCREELASLGAVRTQLAAWVPPEPRRAPAGGLPAPARRPWAGRGFAALPAWAQAAAAVLLGGVGLGAANLHVSYGAEGLTVTTGWLVAPAPESGPQAERPWQSDLDALRRALRAEWQAAPAAAAAEPVDGPALLRQVRELIDESEKRQQRELALRLGESFQELQAQRYADLRRIEHYLGLVDSRSRAFLLRQGQAINDLAIRVSQGR
jgi:hypothetical protein